MYLIIMVRQPGIAANVVRGKLETEDGFPLSPLAPGHLVSRNRFGCPVPRQPARSWHPGSIINLVLSHRLLPSTSTRFPCVPSRCTPPNAIGSVSSSSVEVSSLQHMPAILAPVVGAGKTGATALLYLNRHAPVTRATLRLLALLSVVYSI